MPVQSDKWIKKMALEHQMISPFEEKQICQGKISYGLSSFGYDVTLREFFGFIDCPIFPTLAYEHTSSRSATLSLKRYQ